MSTGAVANNEYIFTVRDAAAYLKLSHVTIYRLAAKGKLPCRKVGGSWRFNRLVLDQWIAGDRLSPSPKASDAMLKGKELFVLDLSDETLSPDAADAILHAMPVAVER